MMERIRSILKNQKDYRKAADLSKRENMKIDIKTLTKEVVRNIYNNKFGFYTKAVLLQLFLATVGSYSLRFIFKLVLMSAEQDNFTTHNVIYILSDPLSLSLLFIFVALLSGFTLFEFSVLTLMVYASYKNVRINWRDNLKNGIAKWKNFNPKQLFFFSIYFLLMIPMSNLGLSSAFSEKFFIPKFITEELMKMKRGEIVYFAILIICGYINMRLIYTIPLTVINNQLFSANLKKSLEMTKKGKIKLLFMWFRLEVVLVIVGMLLLWMITGAFEFLDPSGKSIIYNNVFYTISRIILFFVIIISKLIIISSIVKIITEKGEELCFNTVSRVDNEIKKRKKLVATTSIIMIIIFGHMGYQMFSTEINKNVLIIAHRGYIEMGVENSIEALEGAAKAGADYVELDIQLTKDNKFVVMHDFNLKRLTGVDKKVKDLSLEEIKKLTIRQGGYEGHIPSFEEFVNRAKELDIKLLVELKPHGGEPDNYAELFINEMKRLKVEKTYKTMSGNLDIMEEIESLDAEIETGHIIALQFGNFSDENVDFFVLEDFSFNDILSADAKKKDKDILIWTINDSETIIKYLHKDVAGIITDYPDLVREEIEHEDNSYFEKLSRLWYQSIK